MIKNLRNKKYFYLNICAFVFLVYLLVFSQGGILDFASRRKNVERIVQELERIKDENSRIRLSLEEMKRSQELQKKIVRERLGVIGEDEYLVLFSE